MEEFHVKTDRESQIIDITPKVAAIVRRSAVREGICCVYTPHTTAAITINENADPDVVHDLLLWLERAVPHVQPGFRHGEGNSDSHIKASLVGSSASVLVNGGELVLGRWQGIFLCEFDGPRTRTVHVQWVGEVEEPPRKRE